MNTVDARKLDFSKLDVNRYLKWVLGEYEKLSQLKHLPQLKEERDRIEHLNWQRYYLSFQESNIETKPDKSYLNTEEQEKLDDINERIEFIGDAYIRLSAFSGYIETLRKSNGKALGDGMYGQYTKDDLLIINIPYGTIEIDFTIMVTEFFDHNKTEIHERYRKTGVSIKTFYERELNKRLSREFTYLDWLIEGNFPVNLNIDLTRLNFVDEMSELLTIKYIAELLENDKELNQLADSAFANVTIKPMKWNANKNAIGTLFGLLLKEGIITSSKTNIARFLAKYFPELSEATLTDNIGLKTKQTEGKVLYNKDVEKETGALIRLLKEQVERRKK